MNKLVQKQEFELVRAPLHSDRQAASSVEITNPGGSHDVVLICEHASAYIPSSLHNLGLIDDALQSHIAWDPGALKTAEHLSQALNATLIYSTVSRLVYDCNRPPESNTAIPPKSEIYDVPGNVGISSVERNTRVQNVYQPFTEAVAHTLKNRTVEPVIVTIHSFTPIFNGRDREVEIGFLHDTDSRLADALLQIADQFNVLRNQPYGPEDGVTHTLKEHALPANYLNVMIEIRNDLIATDDDCQAMAAVLARWIERALESIEGGQNVKGSHVDENA